ncbi:biogenesis of lysosome-related organelles complex 1 subunit 1-like [Liolophura sinensis]|uniref:biogenesis of lysosome-related organelles complex 1 subunit 1-like n=1 Tax=Liolophura sinensis TaxID=3198878 RepID=UPI0031593F5F
MLSTLLKQHQSKQNARKDDQEKKKKAAIASATALSHALVDHLNYGVAQAYVNQKKLDTETKILQANAAHFSKQTVQWLKLVEDFNTALKLSKGNYSYSHVFVRDVGDKFMANRQQRFGDVENWARSIETDMRTISSALEYAYKSMNKSE